MAKRYGRGPAAPGSIPFTIREARLAAEQHKDMDEYHRDMILWLCDEVERLEKLNRAADSGSSAQMEAAYGGD